MKPEELLKLGATQVLTYINLFQRIAKIAAKNKELAHLKNGIEQIPVYKYMIIATDKGKEITCGKCGMTSYNINDVEKLYCGNCHKFH